jgi:hypothetical protein
MMTNDWVRELEDSRISGLWFEINGVGAGELLDFILAKDAEIERLREALTEVDKALVAWMGENSPIRNLLQDYIKTALKGDE